MANLLCWDPPHEVLLRLLRDDLWSGMIIIRWQRLTNSTIRNRTSAYGKWERGGFRGEFRRWQRRDRASSTKSLQKSPSWLIVVFNSFHLSTELHAQTAEPRFCCFGADYQAFSEFPIAILFEILPIDQSAVDVRAPLQSLQEYFSPPLVSIAISNTTQLLPALYKR